MKLLLFGDCPMARALSLRPWNQTKGLYPNLLRRTIMNAPVAGRADHSLPACGRADGVCELEAWVVIQAQSP